MQEARVPLREEYICIGDEAPGASAATRPGEPEALAAMTRRELERMFALTEPPTAVMAINDYTAILVEKAALAMGIAVPGTLSITGFDDLPMVSHLEVPLTTVAQPFSEIGETALRVLQRLIADPDAPVETHQLPSRLVVRESTAAPGCPRGARKKD
jgi:GntR family transcriptional regulator, arabinose operon transcriptional repressor